MDSDDALLCSHPTAVAEESAAGRSRPRVGVCVAQVPTAQMGAGGRGDHPPRRPNFVPAAAPSLARVEQSLPTDEAPTSFNAAACAYFSTSTSTPASPPQPTSHHYPRQTGTPRVPCVSHELSFHTRARVKRAQTHWKETGFRARVSRVPHYCLLFTR